MRKIIAIVMTICLMASVLCVPAFALNEAPTPMGVVIRISALKEDEDSPVAIENGEFYSFEDGWNRAMELATDEDAGYDRIVVDILDDWHANNDGEFGSSGKGFNWSTIYIPDKARVMINMNGHTIDRGLGENNEYDGEVILIGEEADVIINGGKHKDPIANARTGENVGNVQMGTIKGGNSDNGAGGIHMQDDSKLTLNNVNVVGNISDDDDGGGIAVYDGATLIMNGGSLSDNQINASEGQTIYQDSKGVGVYVEDSTAILTGVEIKNNQFKGVYGHGAAICAMSSNVELHDCVVDGNGLDDPNNNDDDNALDDPNNNDDDNAARSIVFVFKSDFSAANTKFINNGSEIVDNPNSAVHNESVLICTYPGFADIMLDNCIIERNDVEHIFELEADRWGGDVNLHVLKTTVKNNKSVVFTGRVDSGYFEACTFANNRLYGAGATFQIDHRDTLTFRDCDLGDSDFNNKSLAIFEDAEGNQFPASIFGEGSLAMIVAFAALVVSIAAMMMNASSKKKTAPAQAEQDK